MMHDFLSNNKEELARRCRVKMRSRAGRSATEEQLNDGIPIFLDQLIRTLRIEQTPHPYNSRIVSGPAGGAAALSEVSVSAARHGKHLLQLGLTVDQVVHNYGDLCQAITDLAVEQETPFEVDEFRTLNRCLDNAISDAVTEFGYQRDTLLAAVSDTAANRRMGTFAYELRSLLGTASLAFSAAKLGNLSLTGATGAILERSLTALEKLISNSIDEARYFNSNAAALDAFSVEVFIREIQNAAESSAKAHACTLRVPPVDAELGLIGARDLLMAAVVHLLKNAFNFTAPGTEVILSAYASGDRILIEVQDHCGGLGPGVADTMFLPFSPSADVSAESDTDLTIVKESIAANGGDLTVRDIPGHGCVFSVSMPRHTLLD